MATNPVVFEEYASEQGFEPLSTELSEFNWKNRIVGMTARGFLYVDDRIARTGYYEFRPKLLADDAIEKVKIGGRLGIGGLVLGAFCLFIGYCAFHAGWIAKTHTGPGVVVMPIVLIPGGLVMIVGAWRNAIRVRTRDATLMWMSGPLQYGRTLGLCGLAARYCQERGIAFTSHVPLSEAPLRRPTG